MDDETLERTLESGYRQLEEESMQSRIAELEAQVAARNKECDTLCATIAAMHDAATSPGEGPRRGVVEDVQDLHDERDRFAAQVGMLMAQNKALRGFARNVLGASLILGEGTILEHAIRLGLVKKEDNGKYVYTPLLTGEESK